MDTYTSRGSIDVSVLVHPTRMRNLHEIAGQVGERLGFGEAGRFQLRAAVAEAVRSAQAGNSSGGARAVAVRFVAERGELAIYIGDRSRCRSARTQRPQRREAPGGNLVVASTLMDAVEVWPDPVSDLIRLSKRY